MDQIEDASSFYQNLRSLITLVDHLRDAGLQKYIRLPRIATLGVQSSGKSSVLESIVGINFLPRNEGVCTRRPLELRMVRIYDESSPYGVFEGIDEKMYDFDKVRQTIELLTDKVAGTRKGIVDDPIILTIYSPSCPDLTLVDLPGITRIPLAGSDQGEDIEKITKEMAYKYISDPRTIILCVIPANTDISTSEGLLMAKKVDKAGVRTIGVITKIDIMDRGTDARRVLMGQEVSLKLGFIGVKNRSQYDINNKMRVEDALREEKEFFAKHNVYSTLPPGYLGTDTLTHKLTQVLYAHIQSILPEILKETMFRIKACDDRLRELGPSAPAQPRQKIQLLWNMIIDFCEIFKNTIRGKFDRRRSSRITKDLEGGAIVKKMFHTLLQDYSGNYAATEVYTDDEINDAIIRHEGDNIPGFPSVDVLIALLQPQLARVNGPVMDCISDVHGYLENLAHKIIERVFYRFPALVTQICQVASLVLSQERSKCSKIVESIIESQESYIFTNDYEYLAERTEIIPSNRKGVQQSAQSIFVSEIRSRIDAYFRLVIRNVRDTIPKIIGYFLVRGAMDNMQIELYEFINSNDGVIESLSEPSHIATERENISKQLETLRKAEKILKHDPQMANQAQDLQQEIQQQEEEQKKKQEGNQSRGDNESRRGNIF